MPNLRQRQSRLRAVRRRMVRRRVGNGTGGRPVCGGCLELVDPQRELRSLARSLDSHTPLGGRDQQMRNDERTTQPIVEANGRPGERA
jgi:hypothetical protein